MFLHMFVCPPGGNAILPGNRLPPGTNPLEGTCDQIGITYVMGSRLLLYWKNMWLKMKYCLQIIWRENRKFQWRSWSATIPHRKDMVQAGCE